MSSAPRVSVVIPTYQRRESVRRLLEALSRQTLAAEAYEVIVCIDGSTDGTREMVEAFAAHYTLRALEQLNAGRATACNAGIAASRGAVTVLLDDDMEPTPRCLEAHLAAHEGESRRAVMGAVPVVLDAASPRAAAYIGEKFARHAAKLAQPGYRIGFRDFYSGNLSIRRAVLVECGQFDPSFRIYGNEDGELALRLLRAGVTLAYSADAAAAQHYDKDFAALARDNIAKGKTAVLSVRLHPETLPDTKLSRYHAVSRRWRLVRGALLGASRVVGATPRGVIRVMTWIERLRPRRLHRYYELALDYFYWVGASEWRRS